MAVQIGESGSRLQNMGAAMRSMCIKRTFLAMPCMITMTVTLIGCDSSKADRRIAAVTCAQIEATREFESEKRVRLINEAREEIGGEPFLSGDAKLRTAVSNGLCLELVLGEDVYESQLKAKRERLERERAEIASKRNKQRAEGEAWVKQEWPKVLASTEAEKPCSIAVKGQPLVLFLESDSYAKLTFETQVYLAALGYDVSGVPGDLDVRTRDAISQFQARVGRTESGSPSGNLLLDIKAAYKSACL